MLLHFGAYFLRDQTVLCSCARSSSLKFSLLFPVFFSLSCKFSPAFSLSWKKFSEVLPDHLLSLIFVLYVDVKFESNLGFKGFIFGDFCNSSSNTVFPIDFVVFAVE